MQLTQVTVIDGRTAGISGDMLLGALIDAGAEVNAIQDILNLIPNHLPKCTGVKLTATEVKTHGFRSRKAELAIDEKAEETRAGELIQATERIARSGQLSNRAKAFASKAIQILTEVESQLHGSNISSTHLHEAGSADTLADILGTAAACDSLNLFAGDICSGPVAVGGGNITFSHGTLSVPAPAVLEIARQYHIPIVGGPVEVELATPTGVSMLASLVDKFVEVFPRLVPEKVGYGAGTRELTGAPNFLRVIIGSRESQRLDGDAVTVIETNVDDVSGEIIGSSLQRTLEAGAKDAWITAAQFKKNRPGYILHAICDTKDLEKISEVIIKETGTLGVRYQHWDRFVLPRESIVIKLNLEGKVFDVRVKLAKDQAGKLVRIKPEFEDLDSISRATSMPVREVSTLALAEATKSLEKEENGV